MAYVTSQKRSYGLQGDSTLERLKWLMNYQPAINENWTFYSRLQFIVNQNLSENTHNKSYLYPRGGAQKGRFIFGLAANLDWSGPDKIFGENYGPFIRWEF